MYTNTIDILEDNILQRYPKTLDILLIDHTMTRAKGKKWNIFWATHDYEYLDKGFMYFDQIFPENITGEHGQIIQPRTCKKKETQLSRSRDKAEVFTPSWICNAQNNLIDNAWFGREDVFNTENDDHTWADSSKPIIFPEGKTWKDYVCDTRIEITCGEAPYLASRYDTVTGEFIPIKHRIGLLDRKLRVVSENCNTTGEWLKGAQSAYKSIYGYEWQGDSLLIARETLLYTFIEYFRQKFGKDPLPKSINFIAYIISWNLWQMDGVKCVVPNSCEQPMIHITTEGDVLKPNPCEGCRTGNIRKHNGIHCLIRNWKEKRKDKQIESFVKSII